MLPALRISRGVPASTLARFSSTSTTTASTKITPAAHFVAAAHGLSAADLAGIEPSGPGRRLLKADVLAHVGKIDRAYVAAQAADALARARLDLSGIKLRAATAAAAEPAPPAPPAETGPVAAAAAAAAEQRPKTVTVELPISLAPALQLQHRLRSLLGTTLPLAELVDRAVEAANGHVGWADLAGPPPSPGPPARPPRSAADAAFDDIVGPAAATGLTQTVFVPEIVARQEARTSSSTGSRQGAVRVVRPAWTEFDEIVAGPARPAAPTAPAAAADLFESEPVDGSVGGALNRFVLQVRPEQRRAAVAFLGRLKEVLEHKVGHLVL